MLSIIHALSHNHKLSLRNLGEGRQVGILQREGEAGGNLGGECRSYERKVRIRGHVGGVWAVREV